MHNDKLIYSSVVSAEKELIYTHSSVVATERELTLCAGYHTIAWLVANHIIMSVVPRKHFFKTKIHEVKCFFVTFAVITSVYKGLMPTIA